MIATAEIARQRIARVARTDMRLCLMACYLFCARISEVVGESSPKDRTVARGPTGADVRLERYQVGDFDEEVAVFQVKTAKRGGKVRNVALPLNKTFEPWSSTLYDYFQADRGSGPVFPFTRQRAWEESKRAFAGLEYEIDRYKVWKDRMVIKSVDSHRKAMALHALRHLRATELIERHNFDPVDLSVYGGWTLQSMAGTSSAMQRYITLDWGRYFPKLLKRRTS
jgi:uncharacterized protein YbdZ (MbtH family)